MNREEKKIMRLSVGAHGLVHLYEGVLPPLIPLLLQEFSTDYFRLGLVVTVFSYAFGLGALPAGILREKSGPRRLVTIFLFGGGATASLIFPIGSLLVYGAVMGLFIGVAAAFFFVAFFSFRDSFLTAEPKPGCGNSASLSFSHWSIALAISRTTSGYWSAALLVSPISASRSKSSSGRSGS